MNPNKLAITLTIAAGWLSFNSLIILMYYLLRRKGVLEGGMSRGGEWLKFGRKLASNTKPAVKPPLGNDIAVDKAAIDNAVVKLGAVSMSPEPDVSLEMDTKSVDADDNSDNHVLFVMFEKPSIELNKQLQLSLQQWEAHYDDALHVYSVPGVTPQNPFLVTNAYPPGVMPPVESFQKEDFLISGVSVILKKPKRKRGFDKVQLEKFVTFAQALAALGGSVLDAERQVATTKTYHAIRHR